MTRVIRKVQKYSEVKFQREGSLGNGKSCHLFQNRENTGGGDLRLGKVLTERWRNKYFLCRDGKPEGKYMTYVSNRLN